MGYKVTNVLPKVSKPKKTISVTDVFVKDLRFVDDTGDITEDVISAFPDGTDTVSFKFTFNLQDDEDE